MGAREYEIEQKRKEKALEIVRNAKKRKVIVNKKVIKQKEEKDIVKAESMVDHAVWKWYLKNKEDAEEKYKFQGMNPWKKALKSILIDIISVYCTGTEYKMNKTRQNWDADKLQSH